jgi:hypothetical protein
MNPQTYLFDFDRESQREPKLGIKLSKTKIIKKNKEII